jgi:hypothetical protein
MQVQTLPGPLQQQRIRYYPAHRSPQFSRVTPIVVLFVVIVVANLDYLGNKVVTALKRRGN